MFFNKYPYTDYSQINLDWIMNEIRHMAEQYDSLDQIVQAIKAEVDDIDANIDQAVRDYFNSMTQADIEQLIASALGQSSTIVFCSSGDDTDNTTRLSLCSFIATGNHAVIIDTGNDPAATELLAALAAHGVDTIDAVIITHWHADHIQGLTGLTAQNTIDLTDSVLVCPHGQVDTSQVVGYADGNWPAYMSLAAGWKATWTSDYNGIWEPEEFDNDVINGIEFTFNNLDPTKFADYYPYTKNENGVETSPSVTNYNNFSMVITARYADTACVWTGDIELPATANNAHIVAWADLLQIEHHGLNYQTDPGYLTSIHAKYSVAACYGAGFNNGFFRMRPTIARCHEVGNVFNTRDEACGFLFSPTGIIAYPVNPVTDIPVNANVLSVGQQILEGTDLDELVEPGVYTVQNDTINQTLSNHPDFTSGYKFIVDMSTNGGYRHQIAITTAANYPRIAIRNFKSTPHEWYPWKYIASGEQVYDTLDNYIQSADITVPSNRQNRIEKHNFVVVISFDFSTTAAVASNTVLFQFTGTRFPSTSFVACTASGAAIPMEVYWDGTNTQIKNKRAIDSGAHVYGSVTMHEILAN